MGKHFISVLGTGKYERAVYYCEEGEEKRQYETPFVQEALLKLKFDQWNEGDRITVFVTETSRKSNWEDREYNAREREEAQRAGQTLTGVHKGLRGVLQREYGAYLDDVERCVLPVGKNEQELWEIFQTVYDCIDEGEELYLDITHSLRNIPVQMLSVITFARAVKKAEVGGIYYGAFEAGEKNIRGVKEAPVFDLIMFLDILDWSQAASSFVNYGNSDQIVDLYKKDRKFPKSRELNGVIGELKNITHGLEASRGYYGRDTAGEKDRKLQKSEGTSVLESYYSYKRFYEAWRAKERETEGIKDGTAHMLRPLEKLMGVIDEKVGVFDTEGNLELGIAAVEWAVSNKYIQQGFTALDETVKTFLCVYYQADEKNASERELCKTVCTQLGRYMAKERTDNLTQEARSGEFEPWKKWYERTHSEEKEEEREKRYALARRILMDIPVELVEVSKNISQCRNSMNHFGYSNQGNYSAGKLEKKLEKFFGQFRDCMKQMYERQSLL